MNFMRMITLLQTGYTTIEVVFNERTKKFAPTGEERAYTYKTRDKCVPGDVFVVDSPLHGLVCVTVVGVHDSPQIDPEKPFNYKWTVMRVDRANYDEQVAKETEAVKMLEAGERDKARQEMLAQLASSMPTDPELRERLNKLFADFTGGRLQLPG